MDQQIACIIMSGIIFPWYITLGKVAVGAVITVVSLAARYWRFFAQWLNGIRGRDWASVSAVVYIVSVGSNGAGPLQQRTNRWLPSHAYLLLSQS